MSREIVDNYLNYLMIDDRTTFIAKFVGMLGPNPLCVRPKKLIRTPDDGMINLLPKSKQQGVWQRGEGGCK
jgi:hypothetical protein